MAHENISEKQEPIPFFDVSCLKLKWLDIPYTNLFPNQKPDLYLPENRFFAYTEIF